MGNGIDAGAVFIYQLYDIVAKSGIGLCRVVYTGAGAIAKIPGRGGWQRGRAIGETGRGIYTDGGWAVKHGVITGKCHGLLDRITAAKAAGHLEVDGEGSGGWIGDIGRIGIGRICRDGVGSQGPVIGEITGAGGLV